MNKMGETGNLYNINETDNMDDMTNADILDINNINDINKIREISATNRFKNSFAISKTDKSDKLPAETIRAQKSDKMSILNIGQVLFTLFLLIIVFIQMINLYSENFNPISDLDSNPPENINSNITNIDNINENLTANADSNFGAADIEREKSDDSNIIFILGEIDGKLAILSPDKTTVYETFDVYINTLPEYDRNLLIDGIKVKSSEELHSLLEDYSS